MSDVVIRSMEEKDRPDVANFIYESFWQKMLPLHSLSEEEALKLIGGIMFSDPIVSELYHVAEVDGKVVGMVKLKRADQKEDYTITDLKPLLKIGVIKLIQAGILLSAMDFKIEEGHLFIEMIAVDIQARGQGIGTKLLEHSENIARKTPGVHKLSLQVIEKNTKAKALYERVGFKALRSQWSSVVKGLGGVRKVYFMVKEV